MKYEVIFDKNAIDFLATCDKALRQRIYNKIISAKENPFHFFERMEGRSDYKLRIGDYRVIADINNLHHRIEVTLIGNRKNVYDMLKRLKK